MADGAAGGMGGEVVVTACVALPPPAQPPGGRLDALGLCELVDDIGAKVLMAAVAAGEHQGGQLGQILRIGEEARVAGYAVHGVERLLIVDLALDHIGADVGEVDRAVPGVALELCCGAVILGKAIFQGVVGDVLEAHRGPEGLLEELVQPLAGHLLDDEAEKHIVHVGVLGLGAGLIGQRGGQHLP